MNGGSQDVWIYAAATPVLVAAIWFVVTALLPKLTGWAVLEEHYPDRDEAAIQTLRFNGFYLGKEKLGVSYRGCVTFEVCKRGLRVRIWKLFAPLSSPIFIRWDGLVVEEAKVFAMSGARMKLGPGGTYWMTIASGTARRIVEASAGAFTVPKPA
ncbi:hypothetical protein EH31_03010 [Erythrobacter longus]|uniref:Uncharacterized protein n=1 Tax=Erythrobacter longus TaxID=1044 RepID=A0A074N192_ERYLO|nr:hypothetical protein [Erythrobacter longus]KEO91657.1 hypothetical protein EH31_03010 [Erythrobacter longus]